MDLKTLFHSIDKEHFNVHFSNEEQCLAYLASEKEKAGFVCRYCGGTNYCKGRKPYSRRCTKCKKDESATAGTIFHHCKMPLTNAFEIAYIVCTKPDITGIEISRLLETRHMTCLKFKKRILQCIEGKAEFMKFTDILTDDNRMMLSLQHKINHSAPSN